MSPNGTTTLKRLNVVFHGTFAFADKPDSIEVLIPQVDMHSYQAGNWSVGGLCELTPGQAYRLQVPGGPSPTADQASTAKFDPDLNIFVKGLPLETDPTLIRLQFSRRPDRITTLQRMTLLRENFRIADGIIRPELRDLIVPSKEIGLLHVFSFYLDGSKPPLMEGLPNWRPMPGKDPSTANLHVFADPGYRNMGGNYLDHTEKAFRAVMELAKLGAVAHQIRFAYPPDEVPLLIPDDVDQLGLRSIELVSLAVSNLMPLQGPKDHRRAMKQSGMLCRPTLSCQPMVFQCC